MQKIFYSRMMVKYKPIHLTMLIRSFPESQPTNSYCFLTMGRVENKTVVLNRATDPEWNEEFSLYDIRLVLLDLISFCFNYSHVQAENEVLTVQIWNKILVGSTFLGGFEIPISEIQDLQKPVQWYQLTGQGKTKNVTGSVRLSIKLICREGPALEEKGSNSDYSSFGYEQGTDHNEYYKILLHHLFASDQIAAQSSGPRNRNHRKRGDDDEIIVEKWGPSWKEVGTDGKEIKKDESLDTRNRREEMKKGRISASTKWLLTEYAERYGIGNYYMQLA